MKEKLEKLKKLADAMYYAAQQLTTDASDLHKAMEEYHQFIINEYHKEEPVSDLEEAATSFARKDSEGISNPANFYYTVADKARIFKAGAKWKEEQIMAKAIDVSIAIPYPNGDGGYSRIVDSKEALPFGDNIKVLVIKEE